MANVAELETFQTHGKQWTLKAQSELRIEISPSSLSSSSSSLLLSSGSSSTLSSSTLSSSSFGPPKSSSSSSSASSSSVRLMLTSGTAEILGSELALHVDYALPAECKLPIFTWHGCTLFLLGDVAHVYVSEDTPMVEYINAHAALQAKRNEAGGDGSEFSEPVSNGPRVILVGPTDVGKSSLTALLLNYAVRSGEQPLFIDLDVGQGDISIPGTLSAAVVDKPINVEQRYSLFSPLVLYYGHVSPGENPKLYTAIMQRLATLVEERAQQDPRMRKSGYIINTCGWVEGLGYELLMSAIQIFKADVILVIGQERLYNDLKVQFHNSFTVDVAKISKSGGVVVRDTKYRRSTRSRTIKEYFYGPRDNLCPTRVIVNFADVELFQIGQEHVAPSSALPIGEKRKVDETKCIPVTPSIDLLRAVLALSYAASSTGNTLLESNVAGFVVVEDVDMIRGRLVVLSPVPGRLPSRFLLVGSLKWLDT